MLGHDKGIFPLFLFKRIASALKKLQWKDIEYLQQPDLSGMPPSPRRPADAAPRLGSRLDAPGARSTEGRCRVSDSAAREATDCSD